MTMKIWWQDILPDMSQIEQDFPGLIDAEVHRKGYEGLQSVLDGVAREGTQIDIKSIKHSTYKVDDPYIAMLNNISMLEGVIEAEKQGYDAVIIGCANDPAILEARQAVDIPVIALTETSMHLATTLGHKFGVITVHKNLVALLDNKVKEYNMGSNSIPTVRFLEMGDNPVDTLLRMLMDPETISDQLDELCQAAVAEGAQVILPACAALGPATTLLGYKEVPGTGVPVIDVSQIAVKMAEMRVDLQRSAGLGRYKNSVPNDLRDYSRALAKVI